MSVPLQCGMPRAARTLQARDIENGRRSNDCGGRLQAAYVDQGRLGDLRFRVAQSMYSAARRRIQGGGRGLGVRTGPARMRARAA